MSKCTRISRQDGGVWVCRCGWTGPDPYAHLDLRTPAVMGWDAGGAYLMPEVPR